MTIVNYDYSLALRREEPALHAGSWAEVEAPEPVVAFDRAAAGSRFRVLLDLGSAALGVPLDGSWRVALSTHLDRADGGAVADPVVLRGRGAAPPGGLTPRHATG